MLDSATDFLPGLQSAIKNSNIPVSKQTCQPPSPTGSDASFSIIEDDRRIFGQAKFAHQTREPGCTRHGMGQAAFRIGKDINVESACTRNTGLKERSVRISVLTGQENASIQRNIRRSPCKEVLCGKKR